MAQGADTLKRVFLELGGKSANIILDDADFPAQMGGGAMVCMHGGQGCAITTRMLVPRSRYDEGRRAAEGQRSRAWTLRRPDRPREPAGPADQRAPARAGARPHREGQERRRAAASSAAAGRRSSRRATTSSRRCSSTSTRTRRSRRRRSSVRCSSVIPYEDDDDAVRIANNSRYGLSGGGERHRPRPGVRDREAAADRDGRGERRPVVRARLAVRRLQGVRPRARARHRRLRGVPRDEDGRAAARR